MSFTTTIICLCNFPLCRLSVGDSFEVTDPTPNPSPTRERRAAALVKMSRPYTSHFSPLTSQLSLLPSHLSLLTSHLSPLTCFLLSLSYARTQETNTSIGASTDFFPCAFLIVGPSFFLIVFRNKSLIPVKLDKYYKKTAESINISKKICNFANEMRFANEMD